MAIEKLLGERVARTTLGTQAERVVQVLAQMPQFASYASGRAVAERAGVNVSTVVRTAQQLGFDGWTDLRQTIRTEYLDSLSSPEPTRATPSDPVSIGLRQDMANLSTTATSENIRAINGIADAIHSARRTVVLTTEAATEPGLARKLWTGN